MSDIVAEALKELRKANRDARKAVKLLVNALSGAVGPLADRAIERMEGDLAELRHAINRIRDAVPPANPPTEEE